MSKVNLSKIIETCGKHGVKCIKFDGVEIEFFGSEEATNADQTVFTESLHPSLHTFEPDSDIFQQEEDERRKDADFEHLMLENPAKFEELLANEKLDSYGEPDA